MTRARAQRRPGGFEISPDWAPGNPVWASRSRRQQMNFCFSGYFLLWSSSASGGDEDVAA